MYYFAYDVFVTTFVNVITHHFYQKALFLAAECDDNLCHWRNFSNSHQSRC